MKLVAGERRRPPQIHSFAQARQCAFARAAVSLARAPPLGFQLGYNLGLHERHTITSNTILRAIRPPGLTNKAAFFFPRPIVTSGLAPLPKPVQDCPGRGSKKTAPLAGHALLLPENFAVLST